MGWVEAFDVTQVKLVAAFERLEINTVVVTTGSSMILTPKGSQKLWSTDILHTSITTIIRSESRYRGGDEDNTNTETKLYSSLFALTHC